MLRVFGTARTPCDGVTRRELLRAGGLSLFAGVTLPRLLQARDAQTVRRSGRVRSVVFFNLLGGPSHQDMFDLKPDAPAEIRGEFKPISTTVPGVQVCEHLPRIARLMHKACLIRTVTHNYNSHDPLAILTGWTGGNAALQAQPSDPPDVGAVCQYLGLGPRDVPGAVCMPCYPGSGESYRRGGPYGGSLGSQYDPLFTVCAPRFDREPKRNYYDPVMPIGEPRLPSLDEATQITADRLDRRRSLLQQIDEGFSSAGHSPAVERLDRFQRRAFDLLTSSWTRDAFDLAREPDRVRDRYGRHLTGSSLLLARRLVEAGVPFLSVHQEIFRHYGHSYDMHENNFGMLKDFNLPLLDQVVPALVEDLEGRGLLDRTLVVVMGEMGRSPRVNRVAGRDHWPQCGFSLLFGGGLKAGSVHGTTDRHAAYPLDHPVPPCDLVATIYHLLGIDPETTVPDRAGRPVPIAHGGRPIAGVLA